MRLTHLATAFLSTLSLRRATTWGSPTPTPTKKFLSTLSLRRATSYSDRSQSQPIFLSTLSLRRATIHGKLSTMHHGYFYPRSPCGERRLWTHQRYFAADISIHALLAESDKRICFNAKIPKQISIHALLAESDTAFQKLMAALLQFLSTLSLRRATFKGDHGHMSGDISIHALLAESDRRGRPVYSAINTFLSTLSLRRATGALRLQAHQG